MRIFFGAVAAGAGGAAAADPLKGLSRKERKQREMEELERALNEAGRKSLTLPALYVADAVSVATSFVVIAPLAEVL